MQAQIYYYNCRENKAWSNRCQSYKFYITDGTDTITVSPSSRTIEVTELQMREVSPTGARPFYKQNLYRWIANDVTIGNDLTVTGDVAASSFVKSGGTSHKFFGWRNSNWSYNESQGINSNDSDTKVPSNAAVKDAIDTAISNLVNGAPTALDTLNELAAALNDDAAFSTTVTTALGNRLQFDQSQTISASQRTQLLTILGLLLLFKKLIF